MNTNTVVTSGRSSTSKKRDIRIQANVSSEDENATSDSAIYHMPYVPKRNLPTTRGTKAAFVEALIDADIDLNNECATSGNTPLIAAIIAGELECALLLLEAGALVNKKNKIAENALNALFRTSAPRDQ